MKLSVIIVNWNTKDILYKCLKSLESEEADEIIVVDNASSDGSPEMVKLHFNSVRLILNSENYGFAKAANIGARNSFGDLILLLNSDVFVNKGAIKLIKQFMSRNPDMDIATPLLFSKKGQKLEILRPIPNLIYMILEYSFISRILPFIREMLPKYIQGAAFLIRRGVVEKIGLFDEEFFFYAEDVDFCLRAVRAGFKMGIIPTVKAIHLCGESSKKKSRNEYYIKNIAAKLKFLDKYYAKVITHLVRKLIIAHFFLRTIVNAILLISYRDKKHINEKITLYREIKNICRR